MVRLLFIFSILLIFYSCKSDDGVISNNNPYLTAPPVNIALNLSLPQYNALNFPGNTVVLSQQGIRGIIVYNLDNNSYFAFDLADPNHSPNSCSRMDVEGIIATCPCENDTNSYGLALFGQHETDQNAYPMLQYRISRNGDVINITN